MNETATKTILNNEDNFITILESLSIPTIEELEEMQKEIDKKLKEIEEG